MSALHVVPDNERDPATTDLPPRIKPGALDRYTDAALDACMDEMVAVKMDLRRGDVEKLQAWMHSDQYEKAQALRHADLTECANSLEFLVNEVLRHPSDAFLLYRETPPRNVLVGKRSSLDGLRRLVRAASGKH